MDGTRRYINSVADINLIAPPPEQAAKLVQRDSKAGAKNRATVAKRESVRSSAASSSLFVTIRWTRA